MGVIKMKSNIDLPSTNNVKRLLKRAIDIHCHGVGRFDFTEIAEIRLQEIEDILSQRCYRSILTLYLPQCDFNAFLDFMDLFALGKKIGLYQHIEGVSLEGPLLASHGGTPHKGVWQPTQQQWRQLAKYGKNGLIYVICSPDAVLTGIEGDPMSTAPNIAWVTKTLLNGGVLPVAGHFTKNNPIATAQALQSVYDIVAQWGQGATITDHFYNDMPHNFKHAWRTPQERLKRDEELALLDIDSWSLDNIDEKLGVVPATMIRNAKQGLVKIAMNFDGEHVDLAIAKRTVELVGAENMLMMTDSIESHRLAGRKLHMHKGSTLLYQDEGIVAAGSQGVKRQIENMVKMGLTKHDIDLITHIVPCSVLETRNEYANAKTETACV